jgi:hypothetical protein
MEAYAKHMLALRPTPHQLVSRLSSASAFHQLLFSPLSCLDCLVFSAATLLSSPSIFIKASIRFFKGDLTFTRQDGCARARTDPFRGRHSPYHQVAESRPLFRLHSPELTCANCDQQYQAILDQSTPYVTYRWIGTGVALFVFFLRIFFAQGWYIGKWRLHPQPCFLCPLERKGMKM